MTDTQIMSLIQTWADSRTQCEIRVQSPRIGLQLEATDEIFFARRKAELRARPALLSIAALARSFGLCGGFG